MNRNNAKCFSVCKFSVLSNASYGHKQGCQNWGGSNSLPYVVCVGWKKVSRFDYHYSYVSKCGDFSLGNNKYVKLSVYVHFQGLLQGPNTDYKWGPCLKNYHTAD